MNRKQRNKRLAGLNAEKKEHRKNRSGEMNNNEMPAQHDVDRNSPQEEKGYVIIGAASIVGVIVACIILVTIAIKIKQMF